MKALKFLLLLMISSFSLMATAQKDPVQWKYEAKKKAAGVYEVVITASFAKPWHIYSQIPSKGAGVPTKITFKANPLLTIDGKTKEIGKLEKVYDETIKATALYFSNKVEFVQTVKVKGTAKTNIAGVVEYMVCNDEMCLPPTKKNFDIKLL
jgi:DsbC/DsbD-like thiol-disulfide interchange protein